MTVILNPALGGELGSSTRQILDGIEYRISIRWLAEAPRIDFQPDPGPPPLILGEPGVWALTLAQSDGTVLVAGQILRNGVNVLAPFRNDSRFPGAGRGHLSALDLSGSERDPGLDDLDPGSNVRLVYVPAA